MDHASYLAQRRFGALDGLRALSILGVLWHHAAPRVDFTRLDERGLFGVDMFFVLSGFLIVTLLLRERDRRGHIDLKDFYIRRALRIFPIYYGLILAVTGLLLFVAPRSKMAGPWFDELPILLTYTSNWFDVTTFMAISWSLSAEEQFYLLWPPLERFFARHWGWALGGLLLVSQAIQLGFVDPWMAWLGFGPTEPSMLRETTFTPILLGVLLAHILHARRGFELAARLVGHRGSSLVTAGLLLAFFAFGPVDTRGWAKPLMHLLMFLLVASCVIREDHALSGLLRWRPLARIGVVSYGMYLLHHLAKHAASSLLGKLGVDSAWGVLILYTPLTWLIAELSYRYYEARFLRLKARFSHT